MEIKVRFWDDLHKKFWHGGQEGESEGNKTFQSYFKDGALIGMLIQPVSYGISQTGVDDYQEHRLISSQYTGLKDKNGQEIYGNDVFKLVDRYDNEHHFKVEFGNFSYIGTLINSESPPVFTVVQYAFGEYDHVDYEVYGESELLSVIEQFLESDTIEVIGNIYENPELLEGDSHV